MDRAAKRRILPLAPFVALLIAVNATAESIILDCKVVEGGPKKDHPIQIMIDEEGKLLVYNYQLLGSDFRRRVGPNQFIDLSMKITAGNGKFILANDGSARHHQR